MTPSQLLAIAPIPQTRIETFLPHLNKFMPQYEINTGRRQAAFIAQVLHESGCFKYTREIASGDAYEGRKDLGNHFKGDGRKFKGKGLLQITGRSNYQRVSKALGIDFEKNPELLSTPTYAVQSACWFWQSHKLNEEADADDFMQITKVINGGYTHYAERRAFYEKALIVFGAPRPSLSREVPSRTTGPTAPRPPSTEDNNGGFIELFE